uniref:3-hydroxyisobutyryl-CoA hydrolase, mitochondrial n=1 Tax=Romanomermis culicivorax TaxID=13658 RepID=A0A915HZK9_ROMCU
MASAVDATAKPVCDTPSDFEDVIFHKIDTKRVITLNRPKSLNALNLSMIRKIYPKLKIKTYLLQKYNENPNVNMVIIKGEGEKAFCSGGDVRAICESRYTNPKLAEDFFREEYKLNYLIGSLQVPYIALIDGITMGGGVGLSVHGMYRVATERTLFAMPECQIGLFPDIGGTYFLPRLKGNLGPFLALTGHRLSGRDVFEAGIATHFVESSLVGISWLWDSGLSLIKDLEKELLILKAENVNKSTVGAVLSEFSAKSCRMSEEFSLKQHMDKINGIFHVDMIEDIIKRLEKDPSDWSKNILQTLLKMSPISLKITVEALKLGSKMSLKECLEMEYRLTQRVCADNDFYTGVTSVLIERGTKPSWNPETLSDVRSETMRHYFSPLPDDRELKLVT